MKIIKQIALLLTVLVLSFSCDNGNLKKNNITTKKYNIYKNNNVLRQINNSHQNQNSDELVQVLSTNKSLFIRESLLSIVSICDSNTSPSVSAYIKNKDSEVRKIAVFSLGQLGASYFENKLINSYKNETEEFVKKQILISLGKLGSTEALNFVASISPDDNEDILMIGQGKSFFYFAENGHISNQMIAKTFEIINKPGISQSAKLAYSYFLANKEILDLTDYFAIINNELKIATNIYLQVNLAKSLMHVKTSESIELLKSILDSDADFRVKIASLEALSTFNYQIVKKYFFEALLDKNSNISVTASKFFILNGKITDATKFFDYSKKIISWQARSNMLMAALKYAVDKNKIANSIISGYKAAENKYEKASLLYALSADPRQYKFVKEQTFNVSDKVISTAGIKSLYAMRLNSSFDVIAKKMKAKKNVDIYAEFKIIFKEAMSEGDNAMIYFASKAINNKDLKIIDVFTNTYFISQAMNSLLLPRDINIYKELCISLQLYGGNKCKDYIETNPLDINWDVLSSIPVEQRVLVKTNRGNFQITLDVNSAPATVYTFLKLVDKGYYNNTYFYRNIPGKAIMNGGKRGDGWMNLNIPLIKEIRPVDFQDGTVAMSVNGDNYQSVNWFIAISPEIRYEGKYTVFGKVTNGIDIVHKLEPSDFIIEISYL